MTSSIRCPCRCGGRCPGATPIASGEGEDCPNDVAYAVTFKSGVVYAYCAGCTAERRRLNAAVEVRSL